MKKSLLFILFIASTFTNLEAQVWSEVALPENMAGMAITTHGKKIFMTGKFTADEKNQATNLIYIYDTETGLFSTASISARREAMSAVTVGDKVMFAGGSLWNLGSNSFINTTDTVDVYDVNTGQMSVMKLSEPRRWITSQVVNGKVYFAGGREPAGPFTDVLDIYDPATNSWILDTLAFPVRAAASAVAGDKLLLFLDAKCQILNTLTGEWEVITFPESRGFGRSVVTTEKEIWFIGGSTYLPVIDIYDKATGAWDTKIMESGHFDAMSCYLNGKIIIAGGLAADAQTSNLVEIFDAETGELVELGALPVGRWYMGWECNAPVVGNQAFFPGGDQNNISSTDYNIYGKMDVYTDTTGMTNGLFDPVLKNVVIESYPSPFATALQVNVQFEKPQAGYVSLFDNYGCLVHSQFLDNQPTWSLSVPSEDWAAGVYFLHVRTKEGVAVRKLIKQ
jgi:hypothetical protein